MGSKRKIIVKSIVLVSYLIIGTYIKSNLLDFESYSQKYHSSLLNSFHFRAMIHYLYYLLFGLVIGLDVFMTEIGKQGAWSLNWFKLLIQGIPMAYIGFHMYIYFSGVPIVQVVGHPFFIKNEIASELALVALGYSVITCVRRKASLS